MITLHRIRKVCPTCGTMYQGHSFLPQADAAPAKVERCTPCIERKDAEFTARVQAARRPAFDLHTVYKAPATVRDPLENL